MLKRIRGTPLPGLSYFGGVAANAVTNAALQIGIVVLAGAHLRYRLAAAMDSR